MEWISLAELQVGARGVIREIRADAEARRRFAELGLTPGAAVICRLRGSGGTPVAFTVRGVTLALRRGDCERILLEPEERAEAVYLLAGNPNVGKSTVFNALTGLKQHTGNWCGKTVSGAEGFCTERGRRIRLIDTPGTYSLFSRTAEELAACDVITHTPHDCILCICDATAPERGIRLALELMQLHTRAVLGLNLMDEAQAKGIRIDRKRLSSELGIPVVCLTARRRKTVRPLLETAAAQEAADYAAPMDFPEQAEQAVSGLCEMLHCDRFSAICVLSAGKDAAARAVLDRCGMTPDALHSAVSDALTERAAAITELCVRTPQEAGARARRADRILTHRYLKIPLMLGFLLVIFWLTMVGTSLPSELLLRATGALCDTAQSAADAIGCPLWLSGALIGGMLRGTGWVVSVMLPPMAVFFPLFTLLEDIGLLPRIAFNADRSFARCRACGKQCLTMAMGFGCNAVGVTGCRIIESRRERLIAILTNALVPCNGRLPTLLAIITSFFAGNASGSRLRAALMLTALTVLSVCVTMLSSFLLSRTLLRGEPTSFVLELPPYRRPQIMQTVIRSVRDRTLYTLGRAALTAAPVSLLIWLLANIRPGGSSLLLRIAGFLEPAGSLLGLDGVILLAFLLGLPANEIILPVAVTAYLGSSLLTDCGAGEPLYALLTANGWDLHRAGAFLLLLLFHSPCAATLMTVYRETGSKRWTFCAFALPVLAGVTLCLLLNALTVLFSA